MGKGDDDKLDELMREMGKIKELQEKLGNIIRDAAGQKLKSLRKQAVVELMKKVEACESEEEENALIQEFLKNLFAKEDNTL